MRALRGPPNRGLRDFSSRMALIERLVRSFRSRLLGVCRGREQPTVFATYQRLVKCQERRGPEGEGDLSDASWTEKERPESAEEPVGERQTGCPPTTTMKTMRCCLSRRFSAITARTPPRPHSVAVMTAKWSRMSKQSFMRESAEARHLAPRNVAQSANQRGNSQFETHKALTH